MTSRDASLDTYRIVSINEFDENTMDADLHFPSQTGISLKGFEGPFMRLGKVRIRSFAL